MTDSAKRGGHRAMATRIINELDDLLRETSLDVNKLAAKVIILRKQQAKILEFDELLQSGLEDDDLIDHMQEASEIDQRIEESILGVEQAIACSRSATGMGSGHQGSNSHAKCVKLPTIQLPFFTGEILEWQHFWDVYRSSIHSRADLTGSQKFSYLLGQLKGTALELLAGFSATDGDYMEAVTLLTNIYGDKRTIIRAHLHAIFDIKEPKATASGISSFRASFESHIRALKSLGTKIEEAGFVVVALLMRKLPNEIRDNLNRRAGTQFWELPEFRDAINIEVGLLQSVEPCKGSSKLKPNNQENDFRGTDLKSPDNTSKASTANFQVNAKVSKKVKVVSCRFCQGSHYNNLCDKYTNCKERHNRVKELGLCFKCLSSNHPVAECQSHFNCKFCQGTHHHLLCFRQNDSSEDITVDGSENKMVTSVSSSSKGSFSVALPTAIVPVITDNEMYKIRALFDQGSQCTFLLKSYAKALKLEVIEYIELSIDGFESKGTLQKYEVVKLKVQTLEGFLDIKAVLVNNLPERLYVPGIVSTITDLKGMGICLADPSVSGDTITNVGLLIGADQYYSFVNGMVKHGDIHLVSSSLGHMITGKLMGKPASMVKSTWASVTALTLSEQPQVEDTLDIQLEKLWSLDTIGIKDHSFTGEERDIMKEFQDNLVYSDGRYTARLPWRRDHPPLPLNYGMAKGRLQGTLNRLRKVDGHLSIYDDIIKEQLSMNFIEKVDLAASMVGPRCHYLSHHGIKKDSLTTPLRIVFDCSAGNPSLNDCLFTGPSMVHSLAQLMLRFRLGRMACISDIAKAYLMIALDKRDRDVTRFLWPENPADPNSILIIYRFKVVLFGATCSQFLLNATILHHLTTHSTALTDRLLRNLYIDNLQGIANTEKEITDFYLRSKQLFQSAGLTLREWATNSTDLQALIDLNEDGVSHTKSSVGVLGILWDPLTDTLLYPARKLDKHAITKRDIVSNSAKLFDPLGFLIPVTIRARMLIQNLWRSKLGWDEPVCNDYQREWSELCQDLILSMSVVVPRSIITKKNVELHAFSDASAKAYGAVVYITDQTSIQFCMAKARVAPIKALTIPQMELTAAAMAAQLAAFVREAFSLELNFEEVHLWTDSQIVLRWINSSKPLKSYIRNRVDQIKDSAPSATWHYIPSADNPADLLSRGVTSRLFMDSPLWVQGPLWLLYRNQWPIWDGSCEGDLDLVDSSDNVIVTGITVTEKPQSFMEIERIGSMKKLLKITALVFRAVKIFKSKGCLIKCNRTSVEFHHTLTVQELNAAEAYWVHFMQLLKFSEVMQYLKSPNGKKSPILVHQLGLFIDGDLIRCRGRLQNSDLSYNAKYPILLPNKCYFTTLLVWEAHERIFHAGVNSVSNYVRQKWWVPRLRSDVKAVVSKCCICKKLQGTHYRVPPIPPLPAERIAESRPFSIVGVDLTGAINVQQGLNVAKVYIALFTCAVTRAVHLEVVDNNSAEDFLRCFRRFIGRRSIPSIVYSDNANNFRYAANHLSQLQRHPLVADFFSHHSIQWRFIPARAPWFGGFWERLIGLTKSTIKKVLGRALITSDELRTLSVEVEMRINDRPLTYASGNLTDLTAITPSELLYGYRLYNLPTPIDLPGDEAYNDRTLLTKRQKRLAGILQRLWSRWQSEYLAALREKKSKPKVGGSCHIQIGDMVLIYEDSARVNWKLGRVIELTGGNDELVRSASVRTMHGITHRPVARLYPLEINAGESKDSGRLHTSLQSESNSVSDRPPSRAASLKARSLIASQLQD